MLVGMPYNFMSLINVAGCRCDESLVLQFQRNSHGRDLTAVFLSAMNGVDKSCGCHRNFLMGLQELCASLHFASRSSLSTVGPKVLSRLRR